MIQDIPFRNCATCEYIEDCEHPSVDSEGHPVPPNECIKAGEIKLTKRTNNIISNE